MVVDWVVSLVIREFGEEFTTVKRNAVIDFWSVWYLAFVWSPAIDRQTFCFYFLACWRFLFLFIFFCFLFFFLSHIVYLYNYYFYYYYLFLEAVRTWKRFRRPTIRDILPSTRCCNSLSDLKYGQIDKIHECCCTIKKIIQLEYGYNQ